MDEDTIDIDIESGGFCVFKRGITESTKVTFHSSQDLRKAMLETRSVQVYEDGVTRIPDWLTRFPNLETIAFGTNKITQLSSGDIDLLRQFANLQVLGLGGNFIRELPDRLSDLSSLEVLDVSSNGLSRLPDSLHSLVNLIKFSCASKQIVGIHPDYVRPPNRFAEFPAVLLRMKSLRELNIVNVGMERFPAVMDDGSQARSELVSLEVLDISQNPITELPGWLFVHGEASDFNGIDDEARVRRIHAENQDLQNEWYLLDQEIEERFLERKEQLRRIEVHVTRAARHEMQLRELCASYTRLKHLPDNIGRWGANLEVLDLVGSELEQLPSDIGDCHALETLDIGLTPVDHLPETIGNCKALRKLVLSGTAVKMIPTSVGECARLEELHLSGTEVKTLPVELARCKNLRFVSHKHLRPSQVPPLLWNMPGVAWDKDEDYLPRRCPVDWENRWD